MDLQDPLQALRVQRAVIDPGRMPRPFQRLVSVLRPPLAEIDQRGTISHKGFTVPVLAHRWIPFGGLAAKAVRVQMPHGQQYMGIDIPMAA